RTTAMLAYCESRRAFQDVAAQLYEDAFKKHNFDAAWVHNNRAACLIKMGSATNFRDAICEATEALKLDPTLRAALFNRAYAHYRLNLDKSFKLSDPECLADLNAVMANGPYNADLYYKAALILAASADGDEKQLARTVGYVRE